MSVTSNTLGAYPHPSGSDQPVAQLTDLQKLLLWSVRVWAAGRGRRAFPCAGIRSAFESAGVDDALTPLGRVLATVAVHAHRTLWLRPICSAHMSVDERSLLDLFTACGEGHAHVHQDRERMTRALSLMIPEDMARSAAPSALVVGALFQRASMGVSESRTESHGRCPPPSARPANGWLH